jgi:hypothetical protein
MSQYERRRRGNASKETAHVRPTEVTPELGKGGSGHLATFSAVWLPA